MPFLSVSGLAGGEDDALSSLLKSSGRQGSSTPHNHMMDAILKVQGTVEDGNEEGEGGDAWKANAPARSTSTAVPETASEKPQPTEKKKKKEVLISQRAAPVALAAAAPTAKAIAIAPPVDASFRGHTPANVDEMPALDELVHQKLRRPLRDTLKVVELTRIQKLSWEAMLDKKVDVLLRSETGSGKTLAYALPVIHQLLCACETEPITRSTGTLVIVMCPTRELVLQVSDTLTALLRCAQFIAVGGIHGGENRHKEKARLRKGLHILVTTPGRLLDHLKSTASFSVEQLQTVIMDEADRLLDLGFERAIREIMELITSKLSGTRKVGDLKRILVSATITDGVERLSHFALRKEVVRVGETQDTFSIPATLKQHFVSVPTKHRLAVLISFLRSQIDAGATRIVVFASTADSTEFLYYAISRLDNPFTTSRYQGKVETRPASSSSGKGNKKMIERANQHLDGQEDTVITFEEEESASDEEEQPAAPKVGLTTSLLDANLFKLHGNMTQVDRASAFHAFKSGLTGEGSRKRGILFCTDVAARGLDMPKVDWIVHYDPPTDPASYIHRIGRTARIGNSGDSILMLAPHEVGYAAHLTRFIHNHMRDAAPDQPQVAMFEKKYETFLFYLTKLDPKSNHSWIQSTATLERAITQVVMRSNTHAGHRGAPVNAGDDLTRIALFAYQSYVRAYAGFPKALKALFFSSTDLHLGHVAQSFGIDKSPNDVQRQLQGYIREDRVLARDNRKGTAQREEGVKQKRQRVELEHEDRYHSMLAQKQRKLTRDWAEKRREESTKIKPLQFSEFDA